MHPLRKKLIFYKTLLYIVVAGIILALLPANFYLFWNDEIEEYQNQRRLPHYQEVMRIIKPLEYSGLHIFVQKDVFLTIEFAEKTYTLHNVHKFTPDGMIVLEDGHNGLCGELSTYVYQKISPIFGSEYTINFMRVLESGYFFAPQSSHTILLLTKNGKAGSPRQELILDPSFHRYGRIEDFDNYLFLGTMDRLDFDKKNFTDVSVPVNTGPPILIKDDQIVVLFLEEVEGKFDRDNFSISVVTKHKNKFSSHNLLFMLRREKGQVQKIENRSAGEYLLTPKGYHDLSQKIIEWSENI